MSGGWRITDEEAAADLRHVRQVAREARTREAWEAVALRVEHCQRLGIPETEWLGEA